jgi:hypothetical protein
MDLLAIEARKSCFRQRVSSTGAYEYRTGAKEGFAGQGNGG